MSQYSTNDEDVTNGPANTNDGSDGKVGYGSSWICLHKIMTNSCTISLLDERNIHCREFTKFLVSKVFTAALCDPILKLPSRYILIRQTGLVLKNHINICHLIVFWKTYLMRRQLDSLLDSLKPQHHSQVKHY